MIKQPFFSFIFLFFILMCSINEKSYAQQEEFYDFEKGLFAGGNLGLSFGRVTNIEASPLIGYYVNRKIGFGAGFVYQYYIDKRYVPAAEFNIIGFRNFLRLNIVYGVFAHAEYEYLNFNTNIFSQYGEYETYNLNSVLVGIGYRHELSIGNYICLQLLYNLNEELYTPYSNPVFRVGFEFEL